MRRLLLAAVFLALPLAFAGCESGIRPIRPLERVELWLPDDGSKPIPLGKPTLIIPSLPADSASAIPAEVHPVDVATTTTAPATQVAATQNPNSQSPATLPANLPPGRRIVKIIDRNQTSRFVYDASYDNVWQQSMLLVSKMGFSFAQRDYRLGIITTHALPSPQFLEFWKPQHTSPNNAMENTVNSQRRYLKLTISKVPGKPEFYEISVKVLVEREANPTEALTGPLFVEGSGFGRSSLSLRSDYADPNTPAVPQRAAADAESDPLRHWVIVGNDPALEKKILDELFDRI